MIARLLAALRRVWQRRTTTTEQRDQLNRTRARQRDIVARAARVGIQVDVQTRRRRHAR